MTESPTRLLKLASEGDDDAAARLTPVVYDELRRLARYYLGRVGPAASHTLQPTAVVHEAYLKLVDQTASDFKGRTHFYAVAAVAMRHVLIDHSRERGRAKRGGDWRRVTLSGVEFADAGREIDVLALEDALARLAELDPRAARVVELRFFGGLGEREVGEVIGVSERTVRNDWAMARAWLQNRLRESERGDEAGPSRA